MTSASEKNGDLSIVFLSRVGLRTYQHPCIGGCSEVCWVPVGFFIITRFIVETEGFRLTERFVPGSDCSLRRRFGLFRVVNRTAVAQDRRKLKYLLILNPYYRSWGKCRKRKDFRRVQNLNYTRAVASVADLNPAFAFARLWIKNFVLRRFYALKYGVLFTDIEGSNVRFTTSL